MTAAVAGAETGHGDEPLDACGLHAINRLRVDLEERCTCEDQSRREVNAERPDNYVDVLDCAPDRVAIARIARRLLRDLHL